MRLFTRCFVLFRIWDRKNAEEPHGVSLKGGSHHETSNKLLQYEIGFSDPSPR